MDGCHVVYYNIILCVSTYNVHRCHTPCYDCTLTSRDRPEEIISNIIILVFFMLLYHNSRRHDCKVKKIVQLNVSVKLEMVDDVARSAVLVYWI